MTDELPLLGAVCSDQGRMPWSGAAGGYANTPQLLLQARLLT